MATSHQATVSPPHISLAPDTLQTPVHELTAWRPDSAMSLFSFEEAVESLLGPAWGHKSSRKRKRPHRSVTEELEDILPSSPISTSTPSRRHRADYSPSPTPLPSSPLASYKTLYQGQSCEKRARLPPVKASTFNQALRVISGLPTGPRAPRQTERRERPKERPPVWAESRQELCEALPYYRSFQSGLYMHFKVTFGYLLEAFPAPRDAWASNGRVIISHGGGQCICPKLPNGKQGPPVLQADQSRSDARVDALLTAAERQTPIILIAGEGYKELPWELDCAYVVLGWYWISYTWVEAEPAYKGTKPPPGREYFHRIKIRFDWVESQGNPWWEDCAAGDRSVLAEEMLSTSLPSARRDWSGDDLDSKATSPDTTMSPTTPSISHSYRTIFETFTCPTCNAPSPKIYTEGPICIHPSCPAFFFLLTPSGLFSIPPDFELTLCPAFLVTQRTPEGVGRVPYGVVPPGPEEDWPEAGGEGLGGAGEKTLWRGWVCSGCGRANCRYRWEVWECQACGNTIAQLDARHQVPLCRLTDLKSPFLGDGMINSSAGLSARVMLSRELGAVVAIYELPEAGKVYHIMPSDKGYATELFYAYQQESTSKPWFQRRSIRTSSVKGSLLAQHFAFNSGVPYKYIVDTLSTPFSESPACVTEAMDHIKSSVASVLGEEYGFNEILSVCYREGQKMGYHDDGEPGLGPVVASLSLGSSAIMSFRPKSGGREKQRGNPDVSLSITLSHGDFMIMEGHEIQRRYHHRVVPQGFRIAATARRISEPVKQGVQVGADVEADVGAETCLGPKLSTKHPLSDLPRYSSPQQSPLELELPHLRPVFDDSSLPPRSIPTQFPCVS
ncbi:hypothetical protein IAR50_003393 [Cryptococcus sp. DSM 104548]